MKRRTRQQTNTIGDYNNNKKRKLENERKIIDTNKLIISFRSCFEDLANEILYEIFEYLDINDAYEGFFNLNKRFQNLFLNSNLPIQINISTISKSNFERYYKNLILPNKHRINVLRLSNPFTVDIIFSPPRIITQFIQLETLILDNINAKYLKNILNQSIHLPKLHSLVLTLIDPNQYPSALFRIFRLPKLKSCKVTYQIEYNEESLLFSNAFDYSPIEHLEMNICFPFELFDTLLFSLPKLRYLSINCLVECCHKKELCPIEMKYLEYVSLKLDTISFNQFETLIKCFFYHVQVLRITTDFDIEYLDAKRWEQLILSYMPNLRIFDINIAGNVLDNNSLTYHDLINQFNSSFWIEKQWFFTHQHDSEEISDSGIFHSTDPYRRKDYTFYCKSDEQICSHRQENNLNSVKHVRICGEQATDNSMNYFPNATELTIRYSFKTTATVNRIVPLEKLTKLVIESYDFPLEEIVKLLDFTPNLHTLEFNFLCLYKSNLNFLQTAAIDEYISNRNKIKKLDLCGKFTLEHIQLIVNLFPKLEYLTTGMKKKEIEQIIRFLLSKTNDKTRHLFFLCIPETPKIYLRKLNMLIKSENLLDSYLIKFVHHNLYLWW